MLDELEGLWVLDMAGFLVLRLTGVDLFPKLLGLPAFLYLLGELVEQSSLNSFLGTSLSLVSVMDKLLIMFLTGVSLASFESWKSVELLFLVSKLSSNTLSSQ